MPNWCGKQANKLRMHVRTTMGVLSTWYVQSAKRTLDVRAKALVRHSLFTQKHPVVSPAKKCISPLIEHYFYPVSTAPINYYNQLNLKER